MNNMKCLTHNSKPEFLNPRTWACTLAFALAAAILQPNAAKAVAFRMPNQDPEGIARGNAFAATADNPSAINYNPAGITQLEGQNASAGIYLISADTTYTSPSGKTAQTDTKVQAVPQLYYVDTLKNAPLSFGLGIYAPYGLSLDYGENTPFRTLAENGKLLYACVNPVVAWQIHPTVSIAIGPTLNYSQATLETGISPAPATDSFRFKGDGFDAGFNAGIFWHPCSMLAFGVNYRSATEVDFDGHSQFKPYFPRTSTQASLHFPQFVVAGVSFRPTENWNIEFDVDWTDWDSVNQIVFRGTPFHGTPAGDPTLLLNYTSSFMYELGITRQLGNGYFVSVGYFYSENSSPDKYFNPIVPDGNLSLGSVGFGHHGERWSWALGYHFAYNFGRDVKGSTPSLAGESADGHYRTLNNAVNISATYKF
jgi:long-chain fatty acid transport protein